MSIPSIPTVGVEPQIEARKVFRHVQGGRSATLQPGEIARREFSDVLRSASEPKAPPAAETPPAELAREERARLRTPDPRIDGEPPNEVPSPGDGGGAGKLPDHFGPPGSHGEFDPETGRYAWWNQNGWIVLDTPGPGQGGTDQQLLTPTQHEALLMLEARNPNWLRQLVQGGVPLTYRNDLDDQALYAAQRSGDTRVMYEALGIPEEYASVLPPGVAPYSRGNDAQANSRDDAPATSDPNSRLFRRTV